MEESDQTGEFKVRDRRRFTTEGKAKEAAEEPEKQTDRQTAAEDRTEPRSEQARPEGKAEPRPPRPLDFSTFVLSLANQALFQLGLVREPDSESQKDLQGARQTIDLIALLEEKTRGNLTDQEQKIITETLFQLRMAFVEVSK